MTADRLAQGVRPPEPEPLDPERRGLPASTVLAICDRVLGEVGRRRHMFAWLRVPGSAADEWLPVDAYYPRARLVVMCRSAPNVHDDLYRELIPAHGLGLLRIDPAALGEEETAIEAALAARIVDLEHGPSRNGRDSPRPAAAATDAPARPGRASDGPARTGRASDGPARPGRASDGPAPPWTPVKVARTPVVPALEQGVGLLVGLGLAVILIAEVYLGVIQVAFGAGRVVLGFAIAFEACSRALGTVAAARSGERAWACACAIGGAPIVVWFAFLRRQGRAETEPAPLAGLLAAGAALVAVLALLLGL